MSKQVQFRRGTTAQHSGFTGADGEMTIDTTKKTVVVHDGSTAGGFPSITEAGGTITGNLSVTGTVDGRDLSVDGLKLDGVEDNANRKNKNAVINGNFDIWQRGTSSSLYGYQTVDRWTNIHIGSNKTTSQQSFALGQTDVPNNPKFYSRTAISTVIGTSNFVVHQQRIEDVETFAGEEVTLSFWAKADAARNMSTEFAQYFGTGGSPSSKVEALGVIKHSLTTSWQKFTVTTTLPSVSGKTLGSNDNNSLLVNFWFDAGSDYDSLTDTLGQQSGTFDISQVQLEKGSSATDFERRTISEELALCQRYYQKSFPLDITPANDVGNYSERIGAPLSTILFRTVEVFNTRMRSTPTVTLYSSLASPTTGRWAAFSSGWQASTANNVAEVGESQMVVDLSYATLPLGYGMAAIGEWTADAEL